MIEARPKRTSSRRQEKNQDESDLDNSDDSEPLSKKRKVNRKPVKHSPKNIHTFEEVQDQSPVPYPPILRAELGMLKFLL